MTEPRLTPEAIQIAKAIAAARSRRRFRPLVTEAELDTSLADLKKAIAVVDTWGEIGSIAGETILDYMVSLGTSYLKSGGFDLLTKTALKGIQPLVDYLQDTTEKAVGVK